MSKGRHSARSAVGDRRTTTGSRKTAPGARKAPPEARRASPVRVGGARVAGRRVANGDGRPVVLTALGSGEKLLALVPLALLSAASLAGLAAMGDDDPSPSPTGPGTTAGSGGHETATRQAPGRVSPSAARTAISETVSPVVSLEAPAPDAVEEESVAIDEPTTAGPLAEAPAEPADRPADPPADEPADDEPSTPVPAATPTAAPDPAGGDVLTRAEATARCLGSGIGTLDVLALAACVEELLG